MALSSRKITTYAKNIADLADRPIESGFTAATLKAFFDASKNEEIKASINGIIDDLALDTDGSSGADQIGATAIKSGGAETVQSVLEELKLDKVETSVLETHKVGGDHDDRYLSRNTILEGTNLYMSTQIFTSTEGQTLFTLTNGAYRVGARLFFVSVDGSLLPFSAYTETSTTSFTLAEGFTAGSQVFAFWFNANDVDFASHASTHDMLGADSINEYYLSRTDSGALASLTTTEKETLVGALNEVDSHVDTALGRVATLQANSTAADVAGVVADLNTLIGKLKTAGLMASS